MSITAFLKDKCFLLLFHVIGMSLLTLFLLFTNYSLDYCIIILFCWCLILAVWLCAQFFMRRSYFKKMEDIVKKLDQRYLLGELMPQSFRLEDRLYRAMIQASNKSVIERLRRMEDDRKEYREYIESWVHEIKTPITAIALYCENHRDERSRCIAGENQKIENYVDMALYYARSDEVYKDYLIAKTDLQEIAEDVLLKNRSYLIQCGIQAEVRCPDPVYTDRKWIGFILNQILLNGAKYRRGKDAHVRFVTESRERGVALKVIDNGIGIKAEELPRIFEKGFTGTNGRTAERSTGMGLYLCKKLCGKLGIALHAASVEGEGTEMTLEFPLGSYYSGFRE